MATDYKINGVIIPTPHGLSNPLIGNLITKFYDDASGIARGVPVRRRLQVKWDYVYSIKAEFDALYDLIYGNIVNTKSMFHLVTGEFPGEGYKQIVAYLGNQSNTQAISGSAGYIQAYKMTLHWIEKEGVLINSPTVLPT